MAAGAALNLPMRPFRDMMVDDWSLWRTQFTSFITLRGYNDLQSRLALHQLMNDQAAHAVADIDVRAAVAGNNPTIALVLDLYEARFLPAAAGDIARAELCSVRQLPTETVLGYHSRVRTLYRRAFPNAQGGDDQLIYNFVNGLNNREIGEAVLRGHPADYAAALNLAQAEASILHLRMSSAFAAQQAHQAALPFLHTQIQQNFGQNQPNGVEPMEIGAINAAINNANKKDDKPPPQCFFCESKDHFKNNCPLWQKALQQLRSPNFRGGFGNRGRGRGYSRGGQQGGQQNFRPYFGPRTYGRGGNPGYNSVPRWQRLNSLVESVQQIIDNEEGGSIENDQSDQNPQDFSNGQ